MTELTVLRFRSSPDSVPSFTPERIAAPGTPGGEVDRGRGADRILRFLMQSGAFGG